MILNGWGVGETHLGGYAQKARVKGDWLVPLPSAFTPAQAMAIGTAGYTAMLCVMALERNGITPDRGPVVGDGRGRRRRLGRDRAAGEARLHGHRVDRPRRRSRLSQGPRRQRDHRPRGAVGSGAAARQGALGRRRRHRRHRHARQCHLDDQVRRLRRRLRARAGHGPAGLGRAVHPARRHARWRRQRDGAAANAASRPGHASRAISTSPSSTP